MASNGAKMKTNKQILEERLDALDKETPIYHPLSGPELIIITVAIVVMLMTAPNWMQFII
jgi:hypothetical protein